MIRSLTVMLFRLYPMNQKTQIFCGHLITNHTKRYFVTHIKYKYQDGG